MAPRRSTRSTRASDVKEKEKQAEEIVGQPNEEAVPETAPQVAKVDEGESGALPPVMEDKGGAESPVSPAVTGQELGTGEILEEKVEAEPEGMIKSKVEEPVKAKGDLKEEKIEAKPEGIVKSKVEEPVKSPRHKESERARPEKESSRRKEEREHESEKKDAKPKETGRGHRESGEERNDRSAREGDRKEAVEKKEQGRGDEKKREEKDKVDRSRSDRPREIERRKDDERRKEEDRGKRSEKDGETKREDEKKRQEDRRKEDERRRESERHRRDGDRHKDERSRREDDRSKKEDDRSKREDDRGRKDEGKPARDDDKGRRDGDRSKRDDPPKRDREGERKRDAEKESAPVPLPPPPPLPPNADVEKVNLDALKEGAETARAKDPPAEERARKEERVVKDGDRRGDEKREDLARGRSDKDRAGRRSPPRESDRHRDRGRSDRDRERERERDRERERERDRGRRPTSPPRRKHRSRSRSLSPRDARRRSSPRRRSPPSSRPVNKRAGYYSSGLGGYSPRRRKNGDRDSPSLSPDRKRSKGAGRAWDQPPPGMDATAVALWQQQMAMAQQMAAAAGANPFIQMGASSSLPNLNPLLTGMGSVQSPAVTRSQRRLYLGNLPPTVSDGEVLEFLNAAIISGGQQHVPGTRPVAAVQLTLDKGFGFADFTHAEDATIGTLLDGIVLHGNALKIRRPRDYVPPPTELLAATAGAMPTAVGSVGLPGQPAVAAPGTVTTASSIPLAAIPQSIVPGYISTDVPDGPNKIFLGNIHPSITVEKLREILTAFGQLKHYVMKYNKNVKPFKVYAFLEYMDSAVTPQAIAGLSGLMLARKPLVTAYATPTVQLGGAEGKEPTYAVPELAKPLLEEPSKVLEFANIVTREELLTLTEEEVEEVVEDITLECARFGTVKSSHVPKPVRTAKKEEADDTKDAIVKMEGDADAKPGLLQNGAAVTVKTEPMDEDEKKKDEKKEDDKNEDGNMEEDGKAEEDGKVEDDAEEDDDKKQVVLLGDAGAGVKKEEEFLSVEDPEGVGKIFVEFSREESAVKAAHALHNRVFNGKRVAVGYLPVKLYQKLYGKGFGLSHKSYDERQELSIKVQDFLYGPV